MNFSYMTRLAITFSIVVLMTSCKKEREGQPSPEPPHEVAVLKRIDLDANNYLALEYTNSMVSKLKMVEDAQPTELSFAYGPDKKPVQALMGDYIIKFVYAAGVLSKVEYIDRASPNVVEAYDAFTFNANRLLESTYYINSGTSFQPGLKTVYDYYANGDVKSMTDSILVGFPNRFRIESRSVYEYDAKDNPLKLAKEILYALYLNHTPHNITKQTLYNQTNTVEFNKTYQFEYTPGNVPFKAVETTLTPGSPNVTRQILYTY